MHDLPQSNFVNPATSINCKWFLGMPGLSSVHVNEFTSGFSVNDFYNSSIDEFTFDQAVSNLHYKNLIAAEIHATLFHFIYNYKNYDINFAITEKINTYNTFSRDLISLLWEGNTQFLGKFANIGDLRINFNHYREYALGVSKDINSRLRMGAKIKLLFGKANIYTPQSKGDMYTNKDNFMLSFNFEGQAKSTLPVDYVVDKDGFIAGAEFQEVDIFSYLMNTDNKGYSMDVGFIFSLDETTVLSGSLLDLGWISWKSNTFSMESSGNTDVVGSGNSSGFDSRDYLDEQVEAMRLSYVPQPEQQIYTSNLAPHLYLGMTRYLSRHINAGFLFHSEIYKNRLHPSYVFSVNTQLFESWGASVSYGIQNTQFDQLGLGIGGKIGPFHVHVMSDNGPGFFNLTASRNINLRFGLGFMFGCSEREKVEKKGSEKFSCYGDPYNSVNTGRYRKNWKPYKGRIKGSSRKRYRK